MSRDIRSFFIKSPRNAGASNTTKPKPVVNLSSDDDDAKAKSPKKQQKVSKKSSRRHALSSSEDEAPTPTKNHKKKVEETKKEEKLKPVTLNDVFAKRRINRVPPPAVSKKLQKKESEFHDDDDFEATLQQLDMTDLESEFVAPASNGDNSKSKRKHAGESDEDFETKKIRRDISSNGKKEEEKSSKREKERKPSDDVETKKKSEKAEATDSKSSKRENSANRKMDIESSTDKAPKATDSKSSKRDNSTNRKMDVESSTDKAPKATDSESKKRDNSTNRKMDAESSPDKAPSTSNKLQFHKLTKNRTKTEIVIEPKVEKVKKVKDEHEESREAADEYTEGIDKKKERAAQYNKYLQRGGARNPGSKPIPTGADNCLAGLTFLITGVFDSLERPEAEDLIKQYGGRTVAALSKKTDYLVVGDEAGPSKLSKAEKFGTKQISEDQLLDLIRTKPAGKASAIIRPKTHSTNRKRSRSPEKTPRSPSPKQVCLPAEPASKIRAVEMPSISAIKADEEFTDSAPSSGYGSQSTTDSMDVIPPAQALVDKYRPKNMKQIIGQHGDKSNANKLHNWLKNWHKNQSGQVKLVKPSPFATNHDGAFFKACLMSGPPGVGKTTTAQVVCAELKFDLLEFNASDTRSKRLLKEEVSGILSNTTVKGYFSNNADTKLSKKHVLLMDEVDGMAGNEDRGGLQELIALIKSTEVPIICICNERNHQKMRTLSNYTYDLPFQKPRLEQIKGAMKTLCCRENISIEPEELERMIISTNQDIRQVINQLAMHSASSGGQEKPAGKQKDKDLRLGPWEVVQKVFSAEEHAKMNIHDKSGLFFHDYNIASLFVQENYLSVQPKAPKEQLLLRVAKAANSLAMGDLIENSIRKSGTWSLLPTQACFSSVIPGHMMSGRMTARANFPAWLGRNSRRGKFDRLLQEITVHSRLTTGASKEAVNIDYLSHLRDAIVRPLALHKNEGIDEALNVMNAYHFLREDLESLMEVSLWPGQPDPLQAVDSKVKAAFTRAYNKSAAPAPYLMNAAAPKKKAAQASQDEGFGDGGDEEDDGAQDGDDDNMDSDRMIKAKKATSTKASTSKKTEAKPKAKRGKAK